MPPRLEMRDIRKSYGATVALDGVSFAVNPGEVHALVGQNGAGKSTLMKTLSGATTPDSGEMLLDGLPYHPRNPLQARRAGVAMIYQELSLAPHMSVVDNILLGMEPNMLGVLKRSQMRQKARAALAQLGHDHLSPNTLVGSLSPATQQIVEIARALAVGCRVLVLDEPTSSLTREDVAHMFTMISRLRDQGLGIVYISHFLEEVLQISDRFTVLRDGKSVGGGVTSETNATSLITMMVGRSLETLYPRSPRTPGEPVLTINNLSGRSKPIDASLTLHRGEVLGIAGLIGAGRTEFLRAIFALDPIRNGSVTIQHVASDAAPRTLRRREDRWRHQIGLVSEDRKTEGLALIRSIADNLTLSDLTPFGPLGIILPWRQRAAAQRWIKTLAIKCRSSAQPAGDLSGGNQQKIAIARLLHHDADILLLDEPTRGIDVGSKAQIYSLIDQLACGRPTDGQSAGRRRSVIVVSSYLPELLGICDRVAVMHRGTLMEPRPADQWTEHSLSLACTVGRSDSSSASQENDS